MVDLSIVVVSYNTRELLAACLESVFRSLAGSDLQARVFVVDNASSDGSAAMVRERFPQVQLIANRENLGFAAANNQALCRSQGRYALLLNPDTEVQGDALGDLVRFMDENPRVGVAGAKLLYPDGRVQHSAFGFPTLAQAFLDFFPLNHRLVNSRLNGRYPLRWYDGAPFPVDHPLGACLMARREAIAQVGLLDERFFIYCEEIDWCMRFKRAGWGVYCVPQAEVVHHVAQSTGQFRDQMFVQLWRSRFLLFQKHYGPFYRWAVQQIVRLGLAREILRARWRARRGEIGQDELERGLAAYREVLRLTEETVQIHDG
ncbi:MAG: glycosyltransferase family 2 protein [Anaerolineae bacterium]